MLLQTLCKTEAANRPCPRIVLVCCTALVTGGLSAEGLFQQEASEDLVHFLFGAFEEGLPPSLPISRPYIVEVLFRHACKAVCMSPEVSWL